jgi:putative inorganic carbon (HCO3(-)) transporter
MVFILFLILNVFLLIRPTDMVPGLEDAPFYLVVIFVCLVFAGPKLLNRLTPSSLQVRPITLCVVTLAATVFLSNFVHGRLWESRVKTYDFSKTIAYYLLFVSVVTTPARLRQFLWWFVACVTVVAVLALLQYHGAVDLPALRPLSQDVLDRQTGQETQVIRLRGTGIFNDPNDLSLILVAAMAACLYGLNDRRWGSARVVFLAPLALFGYATALTYSRGGMLSLLAGLLILFHARFGWWKSVVLSAAVLPLMLYVFAGRQTEMDITSQGDTAQERIQYWSNALVLMGQDPVFGIGAAQFNEVTNRACHNSFVENYAELGLLGGTLFVGAFYLALWLLTQRGSRRVRILDPDLRRLRPYLLAMVGGYCVGMFSLSRSYVEPTYMVLALATAFLGMTRTAPWLPVVRFNLRLLGRLALVSLASLSGIYVFVRLFASYST